MAMELFHATVNPRVEDDGGDGLDLDLCLAVGGRAPPGRRIDERAEGIRASHGRIADRAEEAAAKEISVALVAQMLQSRERDRAAREEEGFSSERPRRGNRDGAPLPRVAPISTPAPSPNPNLLGRHHPFPVMYPYQQQVQYVPMPNEFGVPCVMPCWGTAFLPAAGGLKRFDRSAHQPVACAGLTQPARARAPSKGALDGGKAIGATECGNSPLRTTDSTGSNSSTISHQQSGSVQGGGSICSDECSRISTPSPQMAEKPKASLSAEQGPKSVDRAASVDKPAAPASEQRPRVPLVSTTGNGPNGRTVNGFLHRYNDSSIKILCVCHGSSFTPAEFVRHAGGTNVARPLRQIVVTWHEA